MIAIERERGAVPTVSYHLLPNEKDSKHEYDYFLTKFGHGDGPKAGNPCGHPRNQLSGLKLRIGACPFRYINGGSPMMKSSDKLPNQKVNMRDIIDSNYIRKLCGE